MPCTSGPKKRSNVEDFERQLGRFPLKCRLHWVASPLDWVAFHQKRPSMEARWRGPEAASGTDRQCNGTPGAPDSVDRQDYSVESVRRRPAFLRQEEHGRPVGFSDDPDVRSPLSVRQAPWSLSPDSSDSSLSAQSSPHISPQSPLRCRSRKVPGTCLDSSMAAREPGVATTCPRGNGLMLRGAIIRGREGDRRADCRA